MIMTREKYTNIDARVGAAGPDHPVLIALDHDMTKSSITPSVVLHCDIP